TLDLVHVKTLVDPVDEQGLGRVGLRADLAVLALVDPVARDDQREDAERRLGERLRPSRTPRAHAHVGVHVELLPSRDGHDNGGREAGAGGGWPETRRDPAAFRLSLFIPSGAARPVRSVGGPRQGATRLRSACRYSFHRGPRGRCGRWVARDKARPGCVPPVAIHCRSPNRLWRMARTAGPAVSVLSIRAPTPTTLKPWASAVSTSGRDNPPSGPTRRCTRAPTGRVGGRLAASVVPSKRACPPPSPPCTAPSHRQSRSSAGSTSARNSGSGRGTSTGGMTARPHCFAASLATRCQPRTRARWRDSSRSNATRPSWIRSGAIVKRRTDELEGGPALHRDRRARSEAVAADRDLDAGRLRVQDAAEHERASGSDVAGVARR